MNGLDKCWDDLRLQYQMYNAGHFFEMAVEEQKVTGNTKVVDSAKRFADHIDGIFGPNKRYNVDGHQEVEMALIKLYRATGERRYLDLAKFFLDERGHAHRTEQPPFSPLRSGPKAGSKPSLHKQTPSSMWKEILVTVWRFQNRETRHPARVSRFHRGRP